jgi:putative ABC transport system permease protein
MVRWAWRMLRREWRSQVLVTLLLLVAVAVAVCGGSALYNGPAGTFGTATDVWELGGQDPRAMAADIATLRNAYGTVDVVGHTAERAPGLAQTIDYRAQPLHGTYTEHLLAIHRGRYPSGPNEAAVTTGVAQLLGLRLGGSIALDGHPRTIVGTAENPSDLKDDFVLVEPSAGPPPDTVSVFLISGRRGPDIGGGRGPGDLHLTTLRLMKGVGSDINRTALTTLILAAATILLLLVAFVAAAGFAVLAHRRLRQLGMLAAIGATARQVRLVMTATGLLVGVLAAGAGTAVGLLAWPPAAGWLEPAIGHRIDRLNIPWHLVAGVVALAVAMSAAAAWWPARAVSRLPVTLALSGRPPAPRSARRPAVLAALFLAAGLGCLAAGEKRHPPLIVVGTVATALAILFAAPLAIRLLAAAGSRAPVAVRLALRDLARHQARSGAAVAAISLALGIPVAIVVIATGSQATPATGNLSDRQLLVRITRPEDPPTFVPTRTQAQLRDLAAQVDRMAAGLPHPAVLGLDMAYDPTAPPEPGLPGGERVRHAQELGIARGVDSFSGVTAYIATPDLLRLAGADPATIPSSTDVVTGQTGNLVILDRTRDERRPTTTRVRGPRYSSLPDTLWTAGGLARWHLQPIRAGWLIESGDPVTRSQLAATRRIAAGAGLTIEARDGQQAVQTVRATATAAGLLLALAVLAMTVGLIRSEGAADLRTLTATGASAGIRRTLTAATAAGLALLGAVLGTAGAGLGLVAVYRHDLAVFGRVPPVYPLIFLIGIPLAAAAAGWLLAGKEPPAIARRMSE